MFSNVEKERVRRFVNRSRSVFMGLREPSTWSLFNSFRRLANSFSLSTFACWFCFCRSSIFSEIDFCNLCIVWEIESSPALCFKIN